MTSSSYAQNYFAWFHCTNDIRILSWSHHALTTPILLQIPREAYRGIHNGGFRCAAPHQSRIFVRPSPDSNHARLTLHLQTFLYPRPPPWPTLHRPPAGRLHKILHLWRSPLSRRNSFHSRNRTPLSNSGPQTFLTLPSNLYSLLYPKDTYQKAKLRAEKPTTVDNEHNSVKNVL